MNQSRTYGGTVVIYSVPDISNDVITLAANQTLSQNCVLGKITSGSEADQWGQYDPAASDGRQVAGAVLVNSVIVGAAPIEAVAISRFAALAGQRLVWPDGILAEDKATALAALAVHHIIVR